MSSIVLAGDTSGTVTLQAPAVAGSAVITLPTTSGTTMVLSSAVSAVGQIPFSTDGSTLTPTAKIVSGTAVATTSGTTVDFTGIPSWAKRITIMFGGVSTTGTSPLLVQLGISTGPEITGYVGTSAQYANGNTTSVGSTVASGFSMVQTSAADVVYGSMVLTNISGNTWVCSANINNTATVMCTITGQKALAAVLDRVRITTVGGTATFDAGSINILYE
ncbi:hypothetical protein UFOVP118_72 [uncultured Caudovirales phage]|uniref:Uncharacterized protein n=1 Tax=uncultured Caudovirales phage TaxID=2100421 RepID=A0A6J5L8X5_9CAUD|nr:hypothetical protein UFOVP118_72 [uncultured Caudovirales phage]